MNTARPPATLLAQPPAPKAVWCWAGIALMVGLAASSLAYAAPSASKAAAQAKSESGASTTPTKKKKRRTDSQPAASDRKKKAKLGHARSSAQAAGAGAAALALSASPPSAASAKRASRNVPASASQAGVAEARLIEIYQHIGRGKTLAALQLAESLVRDHPNFQLAQLIYGDLLTSRTRSISKLGEVPDTTARLAAPQLSDLRDESNRRIQALRERPPAGAVPSSLLMLSSRNRHAVVVDVSRSRLYLLENTAQGPRLIGDYYVSVGKGGAEKFAEGDLRTPLGVYFLSNSLNPNSLADLYGAGAITMNYPNPLDTRRGKGGSGIWLHGTPQAQFARAPQSTDGCVVVTNSDFLRILNTIELRNTPIVVAQSVSWVTPSVLQSERNAFMSAFEAWRSAKTQGNIRAWLDTYAPDFRSYERTLREWYPGQEAQIKARIGQAVVANDMSMLWWKDAPGAQNGIEAMVLTFNEFRGSSSASSATNGGQVTRQYWAKIGNQWKIVFEGALQ